MDYVMFFLVLAFFALSMLLYRSKIERHLGVFFIIRSGWGIRFIDRLAKYKPGFWEFLADFSVLLSFAGFGSTYLGLNKETRGNLRKGFILSALIFAASATYLNHPIYAMFFVAFAFFGYFFMGSANPLLNFISTSTMYALACSMVLTGFAPILLGVFGLPALMIYVLVSHGINILFAKTDLPGVSPLLPSSRDGNIGVSFPGYGIFIPWWYALGALVVTLVSHEFAHGILTRTAKVRLKSTGILSFLALPIGAFVEPDEEHLNRKSSVDRMRVYTMGSFANMVVGVSAGLLILALTLAFSNIVVSDGMRVVGFMQGYPAEDVLPAESVIYSVNDQPTKDYDMFKDVMSDYGPGETARIETSEGTYELTLSESEEDPGKGLIGVYVLENMKVGGTASMFMSVSLMGFIISMLGWIAFFNINIALVNLLPVIPFDGGRMLKEFITCLRLSDVTVNRLLYAVVAVTSVIFLVNLIPLVRMAYSLFISLM